MRLRENDVLRGSDGCSSGMVICFGCGIVSTEPVDNLVDILPAKAAKRAAARAAAKLMLFQPTASFSAKSMTYSRKEPKGVQL